MNPGRNLMTRSLYAALLAAAALALLAAPSGADRRHFVRSYTPYVAPAGELELEVWTTARTGQEGSDATGWDNRAEFEYAVTDRLTGAAYLNFSQAGAEGASLRFDGPSLEAIYLLAPRGRIPLDPAAYLELSESGQELEIEPKLLLAQRSGRWVGALNLIGEFDVHHGGEEETEGEADKAFVVAGGLSHEFGAVVALGLEAFWRHEFVGSGADHGLFCAGPTLNLQAGKMQLAVGWHPQLAGSPASSGHLDLRDFDRSQVRAILGVDL
jgi:hypothetical protein